MVLLSVKSIKGKRPYMEDRYAYFEENGIIIAFICDGHGGYITAENTVNKLTPMLYKNLLLYSKTQHITNINIALIIRRTINLWGENVKKTDSGSTLTGFVCMNNNVFIFNIGDSRTCVWLKPDTFIYRLRSIFDNNGEFIDKVIVDYTHSPFFVTEDHDPLNKEDVIRVYNSGGKIYENRLNGILSVTRALGDNGIGKGLTFIPDVYWFKKSNVLGPIIMYSDGIYEPGKFMTPDKKDANNFSNKFLYFIGMKKGADNLVRYSYNNGSEDNLTAMVIDII
jgi:serine/threonine protein phosphatase PrpC